MRDSESIDDPRRAFLVGLLAAGAYLLPRPLRAGPLGDVPQPLPAGRSIYTMSGSVSVNGAAASPATLIRPGDIVETGARSRVVFAVGKDAFLLREQSRLELAREDGSAAGEILVGALRLVTGKLLSVFGKHAHAFHTPTATIGIRGTGVYAEVEPDRTYFCTCYGVTDVGAADDPNARETVSATHHDARYILAQGSERIRRAPFVNHTDEELALIEALVGRTPPFVMPGDGYGGPRRTEY
jgi:hypothetical protein